MNPSTKRAREWLYQRKDRRDTAAARDHQTEVFPGSSDGQALPSSPVAVQSRAKVPPVNLASNVSVVHTITMVGTTGQTLDNTGPDARFEGRESDPEGPVGFDTTVEAGFPTTQLVADIPGHVLFDVEWLWGILRDDDGYQDPALGRFRTPAYVTVTRTRGGVDQARTYGRGRVGAAGAKHHLGWTCQKGDIFTFAFPHDDPDSQSMEALKVTMTIIKTAVAGEDAPPPLTSDDFAVRESEFMGPAGPTWELPAGLSAGDVIWAIIDGWNFTGHPVTMPAAMSEWTLDLDVTLTTPLTESVTDYRRTVVMHREVSAAMVSSGEVVGEVPPTGTGWRVVANGVVTDDVSVTDVLTDEASWEPAVTVGTNRAVVMLAVSQFEDYDAAEDVTLLAQPSVGAEDLLASYTGGGGEPVDFMYQARVTEEGEVSVSTFYDGSAPPPPGVLHPTNLVVLVLG